MSLLTTKMTFKATTIFLVLIAGFLALSPAYGHLPQDNRAFSNRSETDQLDPSNWTIAGYKSAISGTPEEPFTNTGVATVTLSTVTISGMTAGGFAKRADTCTGATVTPNHICTVSVKFPRIAMGSRTASLGFTDNAFNRPQAASLSGTGTGALAQLSALGLTFGSWLIGTTSAAQEEVVTNTGTANLAISSVTISGTTAFDFAKSADTCTGATVTPNHTCTVSVKFTPSGRGSRNASLSFIDNAQNSPQVVSLFGTGTGASVKLSALGLTFGSRLIGTTSAAQVETVTNTGAANLAISAVTIGGTNLSDFAKSADTCTGATVTPNSTCTVSAKFTPSATGSRTASMSFTDNAFNRPQAVSLSGTGTGALAQLSALGLTFGSWRIGTTSAAQEEIVTNTGTANLAISSVTISGTTAFDFAKSADTCTGATVTPNHTCTVSVKFTPSGRGSRNASLSFTDNAHNSPQVVSLFGTGTGALAQLSSPGLTFARLLIGTTSAAQEETVTNTGTANLAISSVTIGGTNAGDFAKSSDTCTGATVSPSNTCSVNLTFKPLAIGNRTASLAFADDATNSPQTVGLSGTGALPAADLSVPLIIFNSQVAHTTSTAQAVTVTNGGLVNLTISAVGISGTNAGDFATGDDTCLGAVVVPGGTCTVIVTFTPSATGSRSATLNFTDNAPNSPQTTSLTGAGATQLTGVFTQRYDNSRSGANTQEVTLTPSNVALGQFGKLFTLTVDGYVYAQPLYMQNVTIPSKGLHNVVYVATQHDSVYAFDADTASSTPLWQTSFLNSSAGVTSVPAADVYPNGGQDITPEIGITSTPVIDPASGTLYVTAKTREPLGSSASCTSNGTYNYCYRLHALDVTTGAEKFGGPVIISASVRGTGYDNVSGVVTFNTLTHLQRPGLLLLNGTIYLGFGSHADNDPYHGWLMAYSAATLHQVAVLNITPNGQEGAIWQGGGGISTDEDGYIYVVTANGSFDGSTGGGDYADSVLKLQLQGGQFQIVDYFTPANQATLQADDLDLGSSQALILPDQPGPHPHLLAMGGKDGRVWILNRDNLGHIQTRDVGALQIIPGLSDELLGGASYWNGSIYLQEVGDFLYQYPLLNGLAQTPLSTPEGFGGFPDGPTVITSDGTNNAVLWYYLTNGYGSGAFGVLYAFDANNIANELYDTNLAGYGVDHVGPPVKFSVPTVANGKVYLGAQGFVVVYGLLN